jgi:peptide/nickel transport system permease protein
LKYPQNFKFKFGIFLLICLFLAGGFAYWLAPFPATFSESSRRIKVDGKSVFIYAPEKPSIRHPLGTDTNGYDVLSQLLYGLKYTLIACILVSLIRVWLGVIVGMAMGLRRSPGKHMEITGGIPTLIILIFLFYKINIFTPMPIIQIFLINVFIIAITGLPGVVIPIQQKTYHLSKSQFVEAAISVGAGNWRIIKKHLFPHLRVDCISIFVNEMIQTLNVIGQLGIFLYFLGGQLVSYDPYEIKSSTNEIAGLIGLYRTKIYSETWLVFIYLCTYLLILMSFHFISMGINKHYEEKYHQSAYI